MSKKHPCTKELEQIAKREAENLARIGELRTVCQHCILHRWVTDSLVDDHGEILPETVIDKRLSVYAVMFPRLHGQ